ncbi:twin transmembrane helix small protein [Aestuariivirga sp.]|uniref:twin transmembrane helix small protein n=1 Tax=Aestuariivirga sp. TaxID=2650926 RepID=UPI0039E4AE33
MFAANALSYVAVAAVAVVLVLGLSNMMRGGSPNRSQSFMRWRVILQFAAIVILMGVLWLTHRGP